VKDFSERYPQFGHVLPEIFANPVLGQKCLKNIYFKGRQIISLPGTPTCLAPTLLAFYFDNNSVMFFLLPRGGAVPTKGTGPVVCFP
jgi:hypothetical protein